MNSKSIMLVEDNASDVALTRRALARNGIDNPVVLAEDGQQALDYLFCVGSHVGRDIADRPSLVLLDLKLPRVDGFEVLRRIRADPRLQHIPVVILTSSVEESDVRTGYDLGANSYIRKPISFEQFSDVVRQLGQYWLVVNQSPPD